MVVLLLTPGMLPGSLPQAATVCRQEAFDYHYGAIPRELVKDRPLGVVVTGQAVLTQRGPSLRGRAARLSQEPGAVGVHRDVRTRGWLHLLGNMLFLLIFGNNIEDRFRKIPYLIFYVACGYVAAYGFAFVHPGSVEPLIGASGAIAGVLGAYLALYPRARVWSLVPFLFFIPLKIPAWLVLGLWFVLQWAYAVGGIGGGGAVAYVAHVFGFVAGLLVGLVVRAASSGAAPVPAR